MCCARREERMSSQVAISREQRSAVQAGQVTHTELEVKEFGKTVNLAKGCYHRTNFIIRNTQGKDLRRYWYIGGLINIFLGYFVIGLLSFLHVGFASGVFFIDILWIILFSQYVYIVHTVIPIVVKHPILPALQNINRVNMLLEVQITSVGGRYVYQKTVDTAGVRVGDVELQYNEASSAGLVHLSAASSTIRFQVLSPRAHGDVRQTRVYSYFLLLGAIFHLLYALACLIGILVVSEGKPSTIFSDDN